MSNIKATIKLKLNIKVHPYFYMQLKILIHIAVIKYDKYLLLTSIGAEFTLPIASIYHYISRRLIMTHMSTYYSYLASQL